MSSEQDIYTSSIEIESDFDLFNSEMDGGFFGWFSSKPKKTVKKPVKKPEDPVKIKLKKAVNISTKLIANLIKMIHQRDFFKKYDLEKKLMGNYHKVIGENLLDQLLADLDDKKRLKNVLNINIVVLGELRELIAKNDEKLLNNIKIVEGSEELKKIVETHDIYQLNQERISELVSNMKKIIGK
jgi:hypothetical protein